MDQTRPERRRGRRVNLEAPLMIRRANAEQPAPFQELIVTNISLAGVYFETEAREFSVDDVVMASVSVPEPKRRDFPFTRIAGRSRVVRVDTLAPDASDGPQRFGVALEFGDDVTALTALPSR